MHVLLGISGPQLGSTNNCERRGFVSLQMCSKNLRATLKNRIVTKVGFHP